VEARLDVPGDPEPGELIGARDDDHLILAAGARPRSRSLDRTHLHLLDACLSELEDVHERDGSVLTADMAARLALLVPGLRPAMLITEALDMVFARQEDYLPSGRAGGRAAPTVAIAASLRDNGFAAARAHLTVAADQPALSMLPAIASTTVWMEPLDEARARELTERIRSTTRQVCILLFEAHERRAWLLLAYRSWEQYIHTEFGFSRSRSYELVDQGRVIQAVRAAAGMSGIPDISAYAALQVKAHLPSLTRTVAERTAAIPQSGMGRVVSQIVHELRERIARERPAAAISPSAAPREIVVPVPLDPPLLENLFTAIAWLANMPPVVETIATIPRHELSRMADLEGARQWLVEFAGVLKAKSAPRTPR
jgi:hypothetical protein